MNHVDLLHRPDYTKPLNEPSWGDSDDEEDSDIDMDVIDDEEDDYYDEDEKEELTAECDDLYQDLKEMKWQTEVFLSRGSW